MQIKIRENFKIFSHKTKSSYLVSNTHFYVTICPGLILFKDLKSDKTFEFYLLFKGPVKNFLSMQDLKKGEIKVSFFLGKSFVSYKILSDEKNVILYFEKTPKEGIEYQTDKKTKVFSKDKIVLPIETVSSLKLSETLFLGCHKKMDIELVNRRENLLEIFPLIYQLSQSFLKNTQKTKKIPATELLDELETKIQKKEKGDLEDFFLKVYKALFFSGFIPRLNDTDHQNIIAFFDMKDFMINPLVILDKMSSLIKSLFIQEEKKELLFLPLLPTSFHQGKFTNINTSFGIVDLEWSKKLLKKVIITPFEDVKLKLTLQAKIKKFRFRESLKEKGKTFNNEDVLTFKKDKSYFLDRFQK